MVMSGESDERGIDPNATIQLDALDGVELEDADAARGTESQAEVAGEMQYALPPAEPPAGAPASAYAIPVDVPVARRSVGQTLLYGAMFVALLAVAIAAGLSVGRRARPKPAVGPVGSSSIVPSVSAAPAPEAPPQTLTLPTIEIKRK
jgi:hypothetical protein